MSTPARQVIDPKAVTACLRRAVGPGKLRVRAVTRHAVRVFVGRSAALTGGSEELLTRAADALAAADYRVTRSDTGVYQASSGYIPTLVVGWQLWEDSEHDPR